MKGNDKMKRTARKILTLATSITAASASIAYASPKPEPPKSWTDIGRDRIPEMTAVLLGGQPYIVVADQAPVAVAYAEYGRFLGETQPLVGPDGRPGCGNIVTKGDSSCAAARTDALAKRMKASKAIAETNERLERAAQARAREASDAIAYAKDKK